MDNRVLVAVSVGWDMNSPKGGREDVTMEEKWGGIGSIGCGGKFTRGGSGIRREIRSDQKCVVGLQRLSQ